MGDDATSKKDDGSEIADHIARSATKAFFQWDPPELGGGGRVTSSTTAPAAPTAPSSGGEEEHAGDNSEAGRRW